MGAESSAQRDAKTQEDASASASASAPASAGEQSAEVKVLEEEGIVLGSKPLQKNGQISSMSSLNGHSEDNTLAEVGQPDGVSVAQKEEAPETADTIQDEMAPQVNGEKVEKESPDANDISAIEEKATEEKPDDTTEVGFKKIFRFVGFKFTVKKDKSEEKEPVKLLTVKDKETEDGSGTDESAKKEMEEEVSTAGEKSTEEEKEADTEETTAEAEVTEVETTDATPEGPAAEATDEPVKDEEAEKVGESTPPPQETTLSSFRKLFSGGLFSNLRKKTSIKKTREGDEKEEETGNTEETITVEEKKGKFDEQDATEEAPATLEEVKSEPREDAPTTLEEEKSEPIEAPTTVVEAPESEVVVETPSPSTTTDETKQEQEKTETTAEDEKTPVEVTSEAELLSSQEKAKPQGSPLKKLFAGAGLKKLSAKKQKAKKDTEAKLTESGEPTAEQLQSSTETADAPKADSGPSSPEESGEHAIAVEMHQNESSQEADGEVASDGEKKKEGITAWSSFKKLVTPKRRVKRSSESEDEAPGEKPAKSATLSSSESAALADKSVEEETKEDKPTEEEPQTENTEKLVSSTEEPKKKMDTSVSWEALMCMGGAKKRTRKTSDSDDEDTKIEEEATVAAAAADVDGDQEAKTEAANVTSQNVESEEDAVTTGEPLSSPHEKESTWDTLKRIVMSKNRAKSEEKPEESADQVQSDTEAPKDESSFSLRKFFPGRKKKKAEKQASSDVGSGEEDSDTPAVVPLSEYDQQFEAAQETPAQATEPVEPATVQIKVSAEDRSPSWIPATVEDADDKHDQLSDIPEEAENAATPKSIDTEIAEDDTENQAKLSPEAQAHTGRRLSIAEVKPVTPASAAETTDVPQEPKSESAKEIIEGIDAQISEIPLQTSVAVEDVPVEVASEKTEHEPPTENAESKTNTILEPHAHDKAMAICTGLGTKEIAKVAQEKPAVPVVECLAVVRDALSTEVSQEEKPLSTEKATVTEDEVLEAQVNQVETAELEPVVESSQSEVVDIQVATESYEPQIEKIGVVSTVIEESEIVQPTTSSENSPKAVIVNPITPTSEAFICTQSVEITEPTIETKEVKMDLEQLAATEENIPIQEIVTQMISSTICESTETTITTETAPAIPEVGPTEEAPVITETVVIVASDVTVMKSASVSEPVDDEPIQAKETKEATVILTAKSEIGAVTEQTSEKMEEVKEDVQQTNDIEAHSIVIAQAVVQDAMDKVSEDAREAKKPTTPTATIPTPVQATATTEKEIEIATETPVVIETPVAIICEKPAPKSPQPLHVAMQVIEEIPIEVTGSMNASAEEKEKKPEEELKQAVEVKVSDEAVVVEEVKEIKEESQEEEEIEQVKEEQSKADIQDPDVEEDAEEVKPQSEETMQEDNKDLEIHMPVQVVLQTAHVLEEPPVEEEAVEEFDSNGPMSEDISLKAKSPACEKKLSTLSEEPQASTEVEAASRQPETPSAKCAEVMAQVIEVIEEAVKDIAPVSTEITAAS